MVGTTSKTLDNIITAGVVVVVGENVVGALFPRKIVVRRKTQGRGGGCAKSREPGRRHLHVKTTGISFFLFFFFFFFLFQAFNYA